MQPTHISAVMLAFFLVSAALVCGINEVALNDTWVNLTGKNSAALISYQWNASYVQVTNETLYAENVTQTHGSQVSSEPITLNWSESNVIKSGLDFPYWSSTSSTSRAITSNIGDIAIRTVLTVSNDQIDYITFVAADGTEQRWEYVPSPATSVNLSISHVSAGVNTLSIKYTDYTATANATRQASTMLEAITGKMNVIAMILAIVCIVGILVVVMNPDTVGSWISESSMSVQTLIVGFVVLVVLGLLLSIGIQLLSEVV